MARSSEPKTRIAVLGAGPAGLSAAAAVLRADPDAAVDVFEAGASTGGAVTSVREDGAVVELGPNSMNAKHAAVHDLVHRVLGLGGRTVARSADAKHFYVVRDGAVVALPRSPLGLLRTGVLSPGAKARLLLEPFVPRLKSGKDADEESVDAFFRRRFGGEVAERIVDPGVAGIYSSDAGALSMKYAFGRLWQVEREKGSVMGGLVRGLLGPKPKKPKSADGAVANVSRKELGKSFSFDGGLGTLTEALTADVTGSGRARICTRTRVRRLDRSDKTGRWGVNSRWTKYDAVISTLPPHQLDAVRSNHAAVRRCFDALARSVLYAPVAVVALAYRAADIPHKLDGFGFLVPSGEAQGGLLGVTFSSSNYPGLFAKKDRQYLTAYVGGSRHADKAALPDEDIAAIATGGVERLLGAKTREPEMQQVRRWARGIPRYDAQRHGEAMDAMKAVERDARGLVLAGNYRDGVGLPDALNSGMMAAERAVAAVKKSKALALVAG